MRYFLLSLAINLTLLFLPLNSQEVKEQTHKIKISLHEQKIKQEVKKEAQEAQKEVREESKQEAKTLPPLPKIQPQKQFKKIKKEPKEQQKQVIREIKQKAKLDQQIIDLKPTYVQDSSTINNNSHKEGVCKQGIGFRIINEARAVYPKKAIMLRLRDTFIVEVEFKIDKNANITILSVRGKNEIFNAEARKLTQELQIEILKDGVYECKIVKPYEFKFEG